MLQKTASYIRKYDMLKAGDHVIAGVSGGPDSICLLLLLLQLRQEFGHSVSVVHVDHGIRGAAGRQDAEFVRHFCEERGIECHICRCSVPEYAKAYGMSEEEAGRSLRYAFFEAEKDRYLHRSVKIAVAHNLSDNAETMLFHLARGTGISGLTGIAPVRGHIIRPLLWAGRREIEAYLVQNRQDYCVDATNETDLYSRNKIRRGVMPVLAQINSRAAKHMYQTAQQLREIDEYLKKQAALQLQACCKAGEYGIKIDGIKFAQTDPALQKELLHQLLCELTGSSRDISAEQIHRLQGLFARQNGRQEYLPCGLRAVRVYGGIEIYDGENENKERIKKTEKTEIKEVKYPPDCGKERFSFHIIEAGPDYIPQISKKKYTKCFDYDKIKDGFCIRNREPGDYLIINDSGGRQKLKHYLVNEKIPVKERGQLLLLADGAHIMWVVGYRISSYYKVDEHTRRILEVTFNGGKEDE